MSIGRWMGKKVVVQFSSVQSLSHVQLFAIPWTAACQATLSSTNSWSLPKLMSIELVMPAKHLILCLPFSSWPQSFPASGSFQMNQLFASGSQSIVVSASTSVLPMNTQDWSLRMDWLDLLAVQGTLKSLLQHHSSKAVVHIHIYTMEYYTAIKKNTFESVLMRWMKLEPITQSEVIQKGKHQYSI